MDANFPDVVLRPGGGRRTCRVLFSYSPQNEDELKLEVNDEIDFLEEVEEGWWRGKLRNRIGVFPSNFVCEASGGEEPNVSESEISAPLSSPDSAATLDDAPVLPPKPVKETCRVLFAYDAANDDELTIKKDDIITIITKDVEDKGWWKGEFKGKIGLFPDNFVEVITPSEDIISNQPKKPDRPLKTNDKVDSKIPLISSIQSQKKSQDNINIKDQDEKIAGLKNEGPFSKKNFQNSEKSKAEISGTKYSDKNLDLYQIKADTVASHRKSLELKANENQSPPIVGKKPLLPPPISNKPKTVAGKPNQVKRLSGEINDLIDGVLSKSTGNLAKRSSGDIHDLIDGIATSKITAAKRGIGGNGNEELDFDSVERSDMLTHITASRPKAPGRRPPSKDIKENEGSPLTNGNSEANDKEKNLREREWEKNKPPWVDELKSNLKSTKTPPTEKPEKKISSSGPNKPVQASSDLSASTNHSTASVDVLKSSSSSITVRQHSSSNVGTRAQSMFAETSSKVSELSSRFSSVDKSKTVISASPPKAAEHSRIINSNADQNDEIIQVSKKEFVDLKLKVEKLEKLLFDLAGQLSDEVDRRRILEKELNKLTDLVTQNVV